MSRSRLTGAAVLIAGVLAVAVQMMPPSASSAPAPIAIEPLTPRSVFTDDVDLKLKVKEGQRRIIANDKDPSRTFTARITLQADAQFPWHSHPGPVIVNVAAGELTYQGAENCTELVYPAGTAFVDPGFGHAHTAWNSSDGETVLVATFFSAPEEGALLIPAMPHCGG